MPNKVGRPTDYDPIFIDKVDEYLNTTGKENMSVPKLVSFARYIGVNKDTLNEWRKKYPEFSVALSKISDKQEEELIDVGVYGGKEINATIVKMILMSNHGYKERTDTTTNDKDINQVLVKFIDGSTNN
jgi:hypothetical protein